MLRKIKAYFHKKEYILHEAIFPLSYVINPAFLLSKVEGMQYSKPPLRL